MTGQPPPAAAGHVAALTGEPLTACPYAPGTPEGRLWHNAWTRAVWQREIQSGDAERRTDAMKAEAHATAEAWEPARYGVNPVDLLCAEVAEAAKPPGFMEMARQACRDAGLDPDAPVSSLPWSNPNVNPLVDLGIQATSAVAGMVAAATAAAEEFQRVSQQIAATVAMDPAEVERQFLELAKAFEPKPQAAAPTLTLARKRHGAAAVCPRHGATKGGLCRRCAR